MVQQKYLLRTLFQAELDSGLSLSKEGGLRKCSISYFLIYSDKVTAKHNLVQK